jgi:type IV secretory pathway VirD2 relaxase
VCNHTKSQSKGESYNVASPDDLPVFRPRLGKRDRAGGRSSPVRFRAAVLALMRGSRSAGSKNTGGGGRRRIAIRSPTTWSRRVVVKVHVAPLRGGGTKAAALHLRYIERDGVERDGSPGVLYGADGLTSVSSFESTRPNERHQFRFIVSPEDAGELDLNLYVRRFMARVERDLGQRLEWAAVNHFDTEHPHAHVVLRGVDREGREVRLPRQYVAHGLRARAQEIATEELGPRPERDLRRQRQREATLDRFTDLERALERRAVGDRIELGAGTRSRQSDALLVARLRHLERLRLAETTSSGSWALVSGWKEHLRELGVRGDIIKQMHRALRGDVARYEILEMSSFQESGQPLYGRVVKKGLSDEQRGTYFAIVETPSGRGCYVPLDSCAAEEAREGDVVRIQSRPQRWRRKDDETIDRIARANHGVYEPSAQRQSTENPGERHEKRLGELERLGLAHRRTDGWWDVDAELLSKLDAMDKTEPKVRMVVDRQRMPIGQQIDHPGQVWLDRIRAEDLAPFGFGAELRDAVASRAHVLCERGIDPDSPERDHTLRDLERRALGERIARATGAELLPRMPPQFRGKVRIHESQSGGVSYAEVTDGRRFVVVLASRELRAMDGQTITTFRTQAGRIEVRRGERDRGT